jgi:hypothetical protein
MLPTSLCRRLLKELKADVDALESEPLSECDVTRHEVGSVVSSTQEMFAVLDDAPIFRCVWVYVHMV